MKLSRWFVLWLVAVLAPFVAFSALALVIVQASSAQTQQTTPQTEKKKAKKVWTDDDFPKKPAETAPATPAGQAAAGAAPGQPAAKPGEAKAEEKAAEPGSVEALEKELARLAKDRASYEQQLEAERSKMRTESDESRFETHRDNIAALEEFIRRNEEQTKAVQAQLEEARKKKPAKPAAK